MTGAVDAPLRLHGLFIYPVKSLAGIEVERAQLTERGLADDRCWMVIKPDGRMLTQRQAGRMVTITPQLTESGLTLKHPAHGAIDVPVPDADAETLPVRVHKDTCSAKMASAEAGRWLTEAIGWHQPLRLVKFSDTAPRSPGYPERFGFDATHFADAAPFLIANRASLEALNQHLEQQGQPLVDMRRFRPNLIVDGLPAFAEHQLAKLDIGPATFRLVDHCQRCIMITVNPDNGETGNSGQPFHALTGLNTMPDNPKAPAFGVNSVLERGQQQWLEVGQAATASA